MHEHLGAVLGSSAGREVDDEPSTVFARRQGELTADVLDDLRDEPETVAVGVRAPLEGGEDALPVIGADPHTVVGNDDLPVVPHLDGLLEGE